MNKSLEQYMPDGSKLPYRFMKYRIHKILLVCCSYDGYILEEDGHIESQINQEYIDLNMSNPPSLTRVSSTSEALEALREDDSYDFILTMYNVGEPDVFAFAHIVKERHPNIPVALLTSFSKDIYRRIEEQDHSGLDYIFSWHGNTDLIIGIIKLIEDKMNADEDILEGGVQAILLVEDSIRFYSTYLPELYKLILLQNTEFLKDAFNEQQQVLRKRARPKILLARSYDEATELYDRYRKNLLGVISDVGFILHRNDPSDTEKLDAGIDLCRRIKQDNPLMPVLLQSSQTSFEEQARALGAGFIAKNSKTLLSQLSEYIAKEFAFGDFVFEDPETGAEIGRAKDLTQMQQMIATIPDRAFEYHTSQNHLSKWLYSRGLFPLAASIRQYNKSHFSTVEEHRRVLVNLIRDYRTLLGQGVVARFDPETYSDAVAFARIGEGSLGGKARGLAFMNSMLMKHHQYDKHDNVRIMIPRSVVIATEYFDEFIRRNGLQYIISQEFSDEEILSEFVTSTMPQRLQEELKAYIRKHVFLNPVIWMLAIADFFVYVIRFAVLDWGPTFLREARGLSAAEAGWTVVIFEVFGVIGMLGAGWITDKVFGSRGTRTCLFCMLGAIISIVTFCLLPETTSPLLLLFVLAFAGMFIYGPQALIGVIASNHATRKAASSANGVIGMVSYVSVAISGVGFGFISDHFGWEMVFVTMVVMAVIGLLIFLPMWNMKRDSYGEDEAAVE